MKRLLGIADAYERFRGSKELRQYDYRLTRVFRLAAS
jgi:hypothetical protein